SFCALINRSLLTVMVYCAITDAAVNASTPNTTEKLKDLRKKYRIIVSWRFVTSRYTNPAGTGQHFLGRFVVVATNAESGPFPSSPRRGGRDINKMSRSHLLERTGWCIAK